MVETIRNSDGLTVQITERTENNRLSLSLAKEFERDGITERTAYFARRQIDDAIELLKIAGEKMDKIEDERRTAARATRTAARSQRAGARAR